MLTWRVIFLFVCLFHKQISSLNTKKQELIRRFVHRAIQINSITRSSSLTTFHFNGRLHYSTNLLETISGAKSNSIQLYINTTLQQNPYHSAFSSFSSSMAESISTAYTFSPKHTPLRSTLPVAPEQPKIKQTQKSFLNNVIVLPPYCQKVVNFFRVFTRFRHELESADNWSFLLTKPRLSQSFLGHISWYLQGVDLHLLIEINL